MNYTCSILITFSSVPQYYFTLSYIKFLKKNKQNQHLRGKYIVSFSDMEIESKAECGYLREPKINGMLNEENKLKLTCQDIHYFRQFNGIIVHYNFVNV